MLSYAFASSEISTLLLKSEGCPEGLWHRLVHKAQPVGTAPGDPACGALPNTLLGLLFGGSFSQTELLLSCWWVPELPWKGLVLSLSGF